jgi:RNA polymerase-binding transcription factor DksA
MTKTDLYYFRDALRIKQAELMPGSRTRENIAIERSADTLEEVALKSAREIAVAQLHRESVIRRDIGLALERLEDQTFGECMHCGAKSAVGGSKRCHGLRSASIVKSPPTAAMKVFFVALSRHSLM